MYKDDFDLELSLNLNGTTYAKIKKQQDKAEEWF